MKIIIPTIGTRGDVQPYIALSLGLQKSGHDVTLASHPCMRTLVESYGVNFASIGPDIDIAHETAIIRGKSPHWMIGFMRVMKFSFSMLEQAHPDLLALCQDGDLVIVSHTAAGSIEADQLGIPTVSVTLMPEAIPANDPQDSLVKKMVMKVAGAGMGMMMTRPLDKIRKKVGVPKMGPNGITSTRLNLIPISPAIIPPNPLWETRHRVTGFWYTPAPQNWTPPQDLLAFLDAGEAPVVVSLGAMAISGEDALEASTITLAAVQNAGVRAIIQGWDEPMKQLSIPETVFHAGPIPHDWLLGRASALVHHGGFGTTAAGFKAGIPALVIPHIIDQFIWGQKVAALGVGPQPIARDKLSVSNMTEAILQMRSPEMIKKAAELGRTISSQPDGVKTAVSMIEEVIRGIRYN
jgi:UDP:flavonoid glycosyltransferase YjiC (YdhE family)